MGFGWMLLGYLTALFLSINAFGFLFVPVGLLLMLIGLDELRLYSRRFLPAMAVVGLSFVISLYQMASGISVKFNLPIGFVSEKWDAVALIAQSATQLLWSILLLAAIADLSGKLELGKIRFRAFRDLFYAGAYYLLAILMDLGVFPLASNGYLLIADLLLFLFCFVGFTALLLQCYMRICPEGQEDMPRKPSRFAIVNQFRANYDREEEKTTEATREWLLKRREKNNEKWQNKSSGKRKK